MPIETTIALFAITIPFAAFAIVLAWVQNQSASK
jgi:hypothetical protein